MRSNRLNILQKTSMEDIDEKQRKKSIETESYYNLITLVLKKGLKENPVNKYSTKKI